MKRPHTPGPWFVTRTEASPCSIEAGDSEAAIAKVYLTDPKTRKRTAEYAANAHLIAASPALVKSLERLSDVSAAIGNMAYAGAAVPDEAWAELYNANNEAKGILSTLQ